MLAETSPSGTVTTRRTERRRDETKSGWKPAKSVKTNNKGDFEASLADKPLRYRATTPVISKMVDGNDVICAKATSDVKRHRHKRK